MKQQMPTITIITATQLTDAQQKQAESLVVNRAGKAKIVFEKDPTVLGGIKVTIGGQTYDATLEGQLKELAFSADACHVITAVALTAPQRKKLTEAIHEVYGSVNILETVDPEVIGGIKVIVGSKEFDRTIAGKLTRLKEQTLAQM